MIKQIGFILLTAIFAVNINNVKADDVTISGRQILVNGSPYVIKGICYNPVPKGSASRSFSNLTEDLALMTEAGINTIRVYSPITNVSVLDQIDAAGIKVIISFGYNQGGYYDILSGTFINYVNAYKDHDAILLWELGNEYNYHPEWFNNNIQNWYTALNNAAEVIHNNDPSHPAATAHGDLPDANARSLCPNVDVWGMNVYRWDNPEGIFSEWSAVSSKPMYLSEAGADRYMTTAQSGYAQGENEEAQADATTNILDDIFRFPDICSGVTLFAFVDEWWKAGNYNTQDVGGFSFSVPYDNEANEEYWGIVDIDRNKTMAFDVVKAKYNSIIIGIEDQITDNTTIIYPNPVKEQLNLYGINKGCRKVEIIDLFGKSQISFSDIDVSLLSKNVETLPKGMYFLKISYNNNYQVLRFIKM